MADLADALDIELMRRLAQGDESAFLEFYRRHQAGLYRFAMHMAGRPEAAADVVQETFLTLIRQAGKFDEERGAPVAFVYGIARNHVRKLHEKEGRYVPFADESASGRGGVRSGDGGLSNTTGRRVTNPEQAETVLDGIEREETAELLRQAVLTLPDHYREPLTLCDLEGKSYSETASLLGCPVGTVRSRLNRARSILLEKLRPARMGPRALWGKL
jgi:RNA polymerase sigma-70 factor (ECF subfamily)